MTLKQFDPEKLKRLREKKGLTWLELSRELKAYEPKLSKNSVWSWERGTHSPSAKSLFALSAFFKKPVDYFLK